MKRLLIVLSLAALACTTQAAILDKPTPALGSVPVPKTSVTGDTTYKTGYVCGSYGLNVRTGAGTEYPLAQVDPLPDGTRIVIVETLLDRYGYEWASVTFDGGAGVVRMKYVCQ